MTLLVVRWRATGMYYCVVVIGCKFFIIKCIYWIFKHRGQNIPTFNNINDFNAYIVTLSFSGNSLRTSQSSVVQVGCKGVYITRIC